MIKEILLFSVQGVIGGLVVLCVTFWYQHRKEQRKLQNYIMLLLPEIQLHIQSFEFFFHPEKPASSPKLKFVFDTNQWESSKYVLTALEPKLFQNLMIQYRGIDALLLSYSRYPQKWGKIRSTMDDDDFEQSDLYEDYQCILDCYNLSHQNYFALKKLVD